MIKQRFLVGIISGFLVVSSAIYGIYKMGQATLKDDLLARSIYTRWVAESRKDEVLLSKLRHVIDKHPKLQIAYAPLIAQKMLLERDFEPPLRAISSLELRAPYYARFAETSVLVAQGQYIQALEAAYALKTSLDADVSFWEKKNKIAPHGTILYAFNIVRIAMLEQQLGNKHAEALAWGILEDTSSPAYHPEARMLLDRAFAEQGIVLTDYMSYRVL